MKLAVFTDIHGNLEALKTIINDIKSKNVDEIICLGDTIGLGSESKECLDLIIENNIKRIDSYKKGDILWREIKYYRQWFLDLGIKKVKAVVLENNGNMVRVEIKDYGTKKKRVIKKLKREMKIIEGDKDWINPRYWNKE